MLYQYWPPPCSVYPYWMCKAQCPHRRWGAGNCLSSSLPPPPPPHSNLCISYQCSCFPLAFSGMPVEGNGQGHHAQVNQSGQCCSDSRGLLLRNVFFFFIDFPGKSERLQRPQKLSLLPSTVRIYRSTTPRNLLSGVMAANKEVTAQRHWRKYSENISFLCQSNNFSIELNKAKRPQARALYNQIP